MKRSTRKGFTLVELLVAVSLFSIAIAIAAGGFVRALRTQRQLIALISANSSASLAIEQMAREIRTGYNFDCSGVAGVCEDLAFVNAANSEVTYSVSADGVLQKQVGSSGAPESLTPSNTNVSELSFILLNDPLYPPRITILMSVTAVGPDLEGSATNLQTTVSSRNF